MQNKSIYLPFLKNQEVVSCYAQMRPYREGGNILQKIQLQGKTIIHNYGHGGAGVTLAPGSAIKAVRLLKQSNIKETAKIAVIGSGIIGLFTAFQISKTYPKAQLSIYSQKIPNYGTKDNKKLITSQIAPGFWMAYNFGSSNLAANEQLTTLSYNQYKQLSQHKQYKQIIKQVGIYDISGQPFKYQYFDNLTKQLRPSYQEVKITINDKTQINGRYFTTYKIDMQLMLKIMIEDLKFKGVKFYQRKIQKKQMRSLNQSVIFICAGMGSKQLANDGKMKGIKGHLIEYKNPNPNKYNIIFKANVGNHVINIYMHNTRILLGLTRQDLQNSDVDPAKIKLIQDNYHEVLQSLNLIELKSKL